MKPIAIRLFGLFALIACLSQANRSNSQILNNFLYYAYDTFSTTCQTPTTGYLYAYGLVGGTVSYPDSVTYKVYYGDGTDTTFKSPIMQGYYYGYHPHTYHFPGVFTPMVITTTSNGISDTAMGFPISISDSCGSLQGDLFVDANGNCVADPGEQRLPWRTVKVVNTTTLQDQYAVSDSAGHYVIDLPDGYTYSVSSFAGFSSTLTATCPAGGLATVTVTPGSSHTAHFGFTCDSTQGDVAILGWANSWRPGNHRPIHISVPTNTYCDSFSAIVTLTVAPPLSLNPAGWFPVPTSLTATTATWNVAHLSAWGAWMALGSVYCDTSATMGDTLCATLTISPSPVDWNTSNNTYSLCAPVNNSYDPNDKCVSPKGIGQPGYINAPQTELSYMIRFQNTGNDTAYQVTIVDTLDADFNFQTLQVKATSHPMTLSISDNGVLRFRFDQINLPDSNTNEPASHGFVVYAITNKSQLPFGTQLTNTARIYFDYNPAIVTNTTLNTTPIPTSIGYSRSDKSWTAYPNPADSRLFVTDRDNEIIEGRLMNVFGQTAATLSTASGTKHVSVAELPAGIYYLQLQTTDGTSHTIPVMVR